MKIKRGEENIKSLTGTTKSVGTVDLKLKIGNVVKISPFFILRSDNFKEDFLLGLDVIQQFKLCQDENLKISQKMAK